MTKAREAATAIDLPSGWVDRAARWIIELAPRWPALPCVLNHGDYSPRHLLVDEGQISRVIDLEQASGGDFTQDFAWWQSHHFPGLDRLVAGYGAYRLDSDWRLRSCLFRLQLDLGMTPYLAEVGHPAIERFLRPNFEADLTLMDQLTNR